METFGGITMIRKLKLQGFKSHEDTVLELSRGTNVLLGIMGSGKSSILQGITFGLYGEIPEVRSRKLSANELIMRKPRRLESAEVQVEFDSGDKIYKVIRKLTSKGVDAKLFVEGKVLEVGQKRVTAKITELFGTDFETFTNVVYARQNNIDNFLRYGKTNRVKLIDSLLKIDRLDASRKKLRSFHNGVKGRLDELKVKAKKDVTEVEEIIEISNKKISDLKDEFTELQMETSSIKEKLDLRRLQFDKLDEKRKKRDELKSTLNKFSGEANSLDELLTKLPKIDSAKDKLESTVLRLNEMKSKERLFLSELSQVKSKKQMLDSRILELKIYEQKANQKFEDFAPKLDTKKTELSKLVAKLDSHHSSIEQLNSADAKCPVCDHDLDDPQKHISRHLKASLELKIKVTTTQDEIHILKQKQDENDKIKLDVQRAKLMIQNLPNLQIEFDSLNPLELTKKYEKQKELVSELELKKEKLTKASQREESQEKLNLLHEKITSLQSSVASLGFNEEIYSKLRIDVEVYVDKSSRATSRMQVIPNLIDAKESEVAALSREVNEVNLARVESKKIEKNLEKLSILVNSIFDVQVLVRQGFVELVNELLGDIWSQLYPYGDYYSLRIFVEQEGKSTGDYILQLREKQGWVNVDGFASGGERSIASLALRVAFARSLSKMGLLLLDEPTHNLDEGGVDRLSDILREGMPNVLEQVLIITHEERMEKASTGFAYRLFRNKEKEEPTKLESL
ncbi:MAG: SMC family ATPase [Candidatus Altiarchaeota archaeon]|nr:SMC family ATPase [Candidatus Altiarchaeota archaeon]